MAVLVLLQRTAFFASNRASKKKRMVLEPKVDKADSDYGTAQRLRGDGENV